MRIINSEVIPADAREQLDLDEEPRSAYAMEFVNGLSSMSMVFASEYDEHKKVVVMAGKFQKFFKSLTNEVEVVGCVVSDR